MYLMGEKWHHGYFESMLVLFIWQKWHHLIGTWWVNLWITQKSINSTANTYVSLSLFQMNLYSNWFNFSSRKIYFQQFRLRFLLLQCPRLEMLTNSFQYCPHEVTLIFPSVSYQEVNKSGLNVMVARGYELTSFFITMTTSYEQKCLFFPAQNALFFGTECGSVNWTWKCYFAHQHFCLSRVK